MLAREVRWRMKEYRYYSSSTRVVIPELRSQVGHCVGHLIVGRRKNIELKTLVQHACEIFI